MWRGKPRRRGMDAERGRRRDRRSAGRPCPAEPAIAAGGHPDVSPTAPLPSRAVGETSGAPPSTKGSRPRADSWVDSMDRVVTEPKEGASFRDLFMSLLDTTQQALESAMSGSMLRQTLLTNNLANVDTPGYQPEDVNFQSTLSSALSSGQSPTSVTFQPYSVQQAALSSNGLLYETLTQVAAQRESILENAMGMGQT